MMAEVLIERRKFLRKRVKLGCYLQIGTGVRVRGLTQDLSQEGAMVEFQQYTTTKTGDMGSLMLKYHKRGVPGSMKIRCRVMHKEANRIGLHLFYAKMSNLDQQNLDMILKVESGNI